MSEGQRVKEIQLKQFPVGLPKPDVDFKIAQYTIPALKEGEILVKTLYLSVDPYLRLRTREPPKELQGGTSYLNNFSLNAPLDGFGVGQVVASKDSNWRVGDLLHNTLPWREYNVISPSASPIIRKIENDPALPLSTAIGVLGMPGMTAYLSLLKIGAPKAGETMVVSGAAGAVGNLVGQIGKLLGLRVIGIAGGAQKVDYITKELGFDVGIDYKETKDISAAVAAAAPKGVDIYYDNVGGAISDAVILNLNQFGRVVLCGAISTYNSTQTDFGPRLNWVYISRSIKLEGFVVTQWLSDWPAGIKQVGQWIKEGKIKFPETVREGFENTPKALVEMLTGENTGKMVVHVADPENF